MLLDGLPTSPVEPLSSILREQLRAIDPITRNAGGVRYPCALRLIDGTFLERVFLVPFSSSKQPTVDSNWVPIREIAAILPSPSRLPAGFASQILASGESGPGYFVFTLVFSWWRRRQYLTSMIDFVKYPPLTGPSSVKAVLPGVGRFSRNQRLNDSKVHFCAFALPEPDTTSPST